MQSRIEAENILSDGTAAEKSDVCAVSECINLESCVGIVALCFPGGRYTGIPLKATEMLCISNLGVAPRILFACVCVGGGCAKQEQTAAVSKATDAQNLQQHKPTHTHFHLCVLESL